MIKNEVLSVCLPKVKSRKNYISDFIEIFHKDGLYTWERQAYFSFGILPYFKMVTVLLLTPPQIRIINIYLYKVPYT